MPTQRVSRGKRKRRKGPPCLCVLDYDETLTANRHCKTQTALSQAGRDISKTQCGECELAIVSAGPPRNARKVLSFPRKLSSIWWNVKASRKASVLPRILQKLADKGIHIAKSDVHFFDDRDLSVNSWMEKEPTTNVHQVSCDSRRHDKGICGSSIEEMNTSRGHFVCPDNRTGNQFIAKSFKNVGDSLSDIGGEGIGFL